MPLILRQEIAPGATLGLWKIDETLEELLALCTAAEQRQAKTLARESRRREWIAWHALLQTLRPAAVAGYDAQGGPCLKDGSYIGVSHTPGYAAILLAETPCAVDIESIQRNFTHTLPRYTHPQERALGESLPHPEHYPCLFWCAKETLYKLKRISGIDFRNDLRIESVNPQNQTLDTRFRETPQPLKYLLQEELCCVFGLE